LILACAIRLRWTPDVVRRQTLRDLKTISPLLASKED
jgi:hypothetical protein